MQRAFWQGAIMNWHRQPMLLLVGMCLLWSTFYAHAQVPSTNGTEFWLTFMQNSGTPSTYLFLGSDSAATAKIYMGQTLLATVAIPKDGNVAYPVVATGATMTTSDVVAVGKAIHVTSDRPITLSLFNTQAQSTDASIVYPVQALGDRYVIPSYMHYASANWSSQIAIVAHKDVTIVEITPTAAVKRTGGGSRPAGVPYQIVLNRGDVYQMQTIRAPDDLTGTQIKVVAGGSACSGVAVFSGHQRSTIPFTSDQTRDHLVEQIPPTRTLGKTFVVPPLAYGTKYVIRVIASEPATTVTIDGVATPLTQVGSFVEQTVPAQRFHTVDSDKPVLVAWYAMSWTDGFDLVRGVGDPFMVIVPPIEQRTKYFTFNAFVPPTSTLANIVDAWRKNLYLTLIAEPSDINEVTINGQTIASLVGKTTLPRVHALTLIDATRTCVTLNVPEGVHTINARNGNGVVGIMYGLSIFDSYGFLAGSDFANLRTRIRVEAPPYCPGRELTFIAESQDSADISVYQWYFPHDQTSATGARTTKRFTSPGEYLVQLITTRLGCFSDTTSTIVTIDQPISIVTKAVPEPVCAGSEVVVSARIADSLRVRSLRWTIASGRAIARGDTTRTSVRYQVTEPGVTVFRVHVIDTLGCEAFDTVRVRVDPVPVVALPDTVRICQGRDTAITITNLTPQVLTYQWSGRDEVSRRCIVGARDTRTLGLRCSESGNLVYKVVVTNQYGCKATDSVVVVSYDVPRVTMPANRAVVSCVRGTIAEVVLGDSISVQGGLPPYRYSWTEESGGTSSILGNSSSRSIRVRPSVTTTYVLRVTDSRRPSNCTTVVRITVEVSDAPVADAGPDANLCKCDTSSISLGFDSECGVAPFRYSWSPTSGLDNPSSITTARTRARPETTTTYTLRVTDARNIVVQDTVTVSVMPCPTLDIEPVIYQCADDGVPLQLGGTAQSLNARIEWQPRTSFDDATSYTPRVRIPNGVDSLRVIATARTPEGCSSSISAIIRRATPVSIDAEASPSCVNDTVCRGDSVLLSVAIRTTAPIASVRWENERGWQSTSVSPRIMAEYAGAYVVQVTTEQGCVALDTVNICVVSSPRIDIRDTTICVDSPGIATIRLPDVRATCGIEPFRYDWEPASQVVMPNISEPWSVLVRTDTTMNVVVRVTDANGSGVAVADTMRITLARAPNIDAFPDTVRLCGAADTRDVRAAVRGQWSSGNVVWRVGSDTIASYPLDTVLVVPLNSLRPQSLQILHVEVTTDGACKRLDSIVVVANEPPRVTIRNRTAECPCDSVELVADIASVTPVRSVVWQADDLDPDSTRSTVIDTGRVSVMVLPRQRTLYRVIVTDARGCTSVAGITLERGTDATVPRLRIDTVRATPLQAEVLIPIFMEGERRGLDCEQTTVRCDVWYDESLYEPFPQLTSGIISRNTVELRDGIRQRRLELSIPFAGRQAGTDTLTVLRGRALIGDPGTTSVSIDNVLWDNGCGEVPGLGLGGTLMLDSLCEDNDGRRRMLVFNVMPTMAVAPHPVNGDATVRVSSCEPGEHRLEIIDLDGRVVYRSTLAVDARGRGMKTLSLDLTTGVYAVTLRSKACTITQPIVIHR